MFVYLEVFLVPLRLFGGNMCCTPSRILLFRNLHYEKMKFHFRRMHSLITSVQTFCMPKMKKCAKTVVHLLRCYLCADRPLLRLAGGGEERQDGQEDERG